VVARRTAWIALLGGLFGVLAPVVLVPVAATEAVAAPRESSAVTEVAAAESHSCALAFNTIQCWGSNDDGRLGDGTSVDRRTGLPVDASGLGDVTFTRLVAGSTHSCALSTAGAAYCWGENMYGGLGDGTTTDRRTPVPAATGALAGVTIADIGVGYRFSCALTTAGAVYCWGNNTFGQLGNATTTTSSGPVAVHLGGVVATALSVGYRHSCVRSAAGTAYCWGDNVTGQIGDGTNTLRSAPVAVTTSGALSGVTIAQIVTGQNHTCALSTTGAAYCWGNNTQRQLGDGTNTTRWTPGPVDQFGALAGVTVADLAIGYRHTCARSTTGAAYCWGFNSQGQLGDGSTTNRSTPVAVTSTGALAGVTIARLDGGSAHTCAVSTAGLPYCWGANAVGQLGDGTTVNRSTAVAGIVASGPPTGVTVNTGDGQITVSWTAPAGLGTGTFIRYLASATAASAGTGSSCESTVLTTTTCAITGLANGVAYDVRVVAVTSSGTSAPGPAVPAAVPGVPVQQNPSLADTGAASWRVLVAGLCLLGLGLRLRTTTRRRLG
jgi:alpha-tubulin suppressor-like RCC1 family protein